MYTSVDGKEWGATAAQGAFPRGADRQTVKFAQSVTTRFLKFVADSSFGAAKPYASNAEPDVIPAK